MSSQLTIEELLIKVQETGASDLHITANAMPTLRVDGELVAILGMEKLSLKDTESLAMEILEKDGLKKILKEKGEVDFAYCKQSFGRYRVNIYKQKDTYAIAMRHIKANIPSMESLGLPVEILEGLCGNTRGLILITGPTGSGKSTTLATMIDYINRTRRCHILTLEEPIEYLHEHKESIVSQREIGRDSLSYAAGLRAALREDPDVILVGEMRDPETIATAITAAETGHLVFSTLHTLGTSQTIDRIIGAFPPYEKDQIRTQLASMLKGVMSQQLMVKSDTQGRCLAYEVMMNTPAISNLIREGKTYQIVSHLQTGRKMGMQTMDTSLMSLYEEGLITVDQVKNHSFQPEEVERLIERML